jgi:DNA replication protein DnaC
MSDTSSVISDASSDQNQPQLQRNRSFSQIGEVGNVLEDAANRDIMVYCRFRPFIKFELSDTDRKAQCSVAFHKLGKNALLRYGVEKPIKFDFDRVFSMSSTQESVFETVGIPVVQDIVQGYNAVVVSLGGQGTGKTYTLFGNSLNWNEVSGVKHLKQY